MAKIAEKELDEVKPQKIYTIYGYVSKFEENLKVKSFTTPEEATEFMRSYNRTPIEQKPDVKEHMGVKLKHYYETMFIEVETLG